MGHRDRATAHDHLTIVCEQCSERIGGCRCFASGGLTQRQGLCQNCKEKSERTSFVWLGSVPNLANQIKAVLGPIAIKALVEKLRPVE